MTINLAAGYDIHCADQLLVVLSGAARPLRCREVVEVLGEGPSVAGMVNGPAAGWRSW